MLQSVKVWRTRLPMIKFRRSKKNPIEQKRSLTLSRNQHEEEDLKSLQKKWYKKLKEDGFNDIEDVDSPREYLKIWSTHFHYQYTPEEFQEKQEYYQLAQNFLHAYDFAWIPGKSIINWVDRDVWKMHSEGQSYRKIADVLTEQGFKTNKDTVNKIVTRLVEIMKTHSL